MNSQFTKIKTILIEMDENPDVSGTWDYESMIEKEIPPRDVDISGFIENELMGADVSINEYYLAQAFLLFAMHGHKEVNSFAKKLLDDPDDSVGVMAASALIVAGDSSGLRWIKEKSCTSPNVHLDILESLEEVSDYLTSEESQEVIALIDSHKRK